MAPDPDTAPPSGTDEQPVLCEVAEIAANAPLAVRAMKRLYRHGLTEDFPAHTHHVLLQTMQLFGTEDFHEGISSFAEGRDPDFQGR